MKLAALFSGGKDSVYAMHIAKKNHDVSCLITIKSKNKESYMFHTPNINLTELQAESIGLPLLTIETKGEKEKELTDLKNGIKKAKELFDIEGVVTGAISSVYQAARIQKICAELDLWCFNPLWQKDQLELLNELLNEKFKVMLSGVFAYPFSEGWLGRILDQNALLELKEMKEKYKINPAGEGGEFESLVLNCPSFSKEIKVKKAEKKYSNYSGIYDVKEAVLE